MHCLSICEGLALCLCGMPLFLKYLHYKPSSSNKSNRLPPCTSAPPRGPSERGKCWRGNKTSETKSPRLEEHPNQRLWWLGGEAPKGGPQAADPGVGIPAHRVRHLHKAHHIQQQQSSQYAQPKKPTMSQRLSHPHHTSQNSENTTDKSNFMLVG